MASTPSFSDGSGDDTGGAWAGASDRELVGRAGRGDIAAFDELYRRHRDFVVRVAWRFAGDEAGAMDAAQEAFAYLLRKLPRLRLTGRLTTYLYPVVKSVALTVRRREGKRLGVESWGAASEVAEVGRRSAGLAGSRGDEDGVRRALRAGLETLNEGQREVLLMRAVDGMSMEEISVALGVPVGTVKSRLHAALGVLRGDAGLRECFEG